jgi:nicotinic acid mononucleotide adenylyltransferase
MQKGHFTQIREKVAKEINATSKELNQNSILLSHKVFGLDLKAIILTRLKQLEQLYEKKEINPHIQLNINRDENRKDTSIKANIAIFPVAANPPHWAHILTAIDAIAEYKLDKVIFLVNGTDPRKPDLIDLKYRYEMMHNAADIFAPFLTFSNIAEEPYMDKALPLIGEFTLFKFLKLNNKTKMNIYYIAGSDHLNRTVIKNGEEQLDTVGHLEENIQQKLLGYNSQQHTIKALFVSRNSQEFQNNKGKIKDPKIDIQKLNPSIISSSTIIRELRIKNPHDKAVIFCITHSNHKLIEKYKLYIDE